MIVTSIAGVDFNGYTTIWSPIYLVVNGGLTIFIIARLMYVHPAPCPNSTSHRSLEC
jgi:hypothetical protein